MQHQVVVIVPLAVGQDLGIETIHRRTDDIQLDDSVVVAIDGLAPVPPGGYVADSAGELDAKGAGHARSMRDWGKT